MPAWSIWLLAIPFTALYLGVYIVMRRPSFGDEPEPPNNGPAVTSTTTPSTSNEEHQ